MDKINGQSNYGGLDTMFRRMYGALLYVKMCLSRLYSLVSVITGVSQIKYMLQSHWSLSYTENS